MNPPPSVTSALANTDSGRVGNVDPNGPAGPYLVSRFPSAPLGRPGSFMSPDRNYYNTDILSMLPPINRPGPLHPSITAVIDRIEALCGCAPAQRPADPPMFPAVLALRWFRDYQRRRTVPRHSRRAEQLEQAFTELYLELLYPGRAAVGGEEPPYAPPPYQIVAEEAVGPIPTYEVASQALHMDALPSYQTALQQHPLRPRAPPLPVPHNPTGSPFASAFGIPLSPRALRHAGPPVRRPRNLLPPGEPSLGATILPREEPTFFSGPLTSEELPFGMPTFMDSYAAIRRIRDAARSLPPP